MARSKADGPARQRSGSQADSGSRIRGWRAAPFWCGVSSSLLLVLAFPPIGLWPLAFLAPAPLVWLCRKKQLSGPRPYRWLWIGASIGWLTLLQGVRLPHPVLYIGWVALSIYVAAYTPLFVALTRTIVLPLRTPIVIAAPIVWVALELVRGYFATGFSVGLVSHPLIFWTEIIQLADLGGAYAVSLIVLIAASCIARAAPCDDQRAAPWPVIPLTIAIGGAWLYGSYCLNHLPPTPMDEGVPVCLLQSNQDVIFVDDPKRNVDIYEQCLERAIEAKRGDPQLRLVIWPESTSSANKPDVLIDAPLPRPPSYIEIEQEKFERRLKWGVENFEEHAARTAKLVNDAARPFGFYDKGEDNDTERPERAPTTFQLLGVQSERFGDHEPERLNTALFVDPSGKTVGRYHKVHRVMFGEYVPLGDQFPWIYAWTPMPRGLTSGDAPASFELDRVRFCPNICFESTVPHMIRGQFQTLAASGEAPDVMVNVSNDGWFWGSSILDLHFACNVFRAVELRRPMISSANTGITAWVDDGGRIRARAKRRTVAAIFGSARPARVNRSFYARNGDLGPGFCLLLSLVAGVIGWRKARRA